MPVWVLTSLSMQIRLKTASLSRMVNMAKFTGADGYTTSLVLLSTSAGVAEKCKDLTMLMLINPHA